jgi:hypothetical protein
MGTHGEQGTNPKNPNPIRSGCIASTTSWAKILAQLFCQANQLECFSFQTYFTRHLLGCSRVRFPQGVKAKVEPKLSNPTGAATERNPKGFTLRGKAKLKI